MRHLPPEATKLAQPQSERDVVVNVHVRVEGVVLEHHRDVAIFGRHVVHAAVSDEDVAFSRLLQPGKHAQGGRFAATGGADEHHELAVPNLEVEVIDGAHAFAKDFRYVAEGDGCQVRNPRWKRRV